MQFITADSVFATHDEPHGGKPLLKSNRTVLKHGADLEREFLLRVIAIAAIDLRFLKVGDFLGIAVRAAHFAIKPAHRNHELAAVLGTLEKLDGLLECFWTFHARNVAGKR